MPPKGERKKQKATRALRFPLPPVRFAVPRFSGSRRAGTERPPYRRRRSDRRTGSVVLGSWFLVLAAFFILSACSSPLSREPEAPPTPTPPFARESAVVATAEASGDAQASAAAYY